MNVLTRLSACLLATFPVAWVVFAGVLIVAGGLCWFLLLARRPSSLLGRIRELASGFGGVLEYQHIQVPAEHALIDVVSSGRTATEQFVRIRKAIDQSDVRLELYPDRVQSEHRSVLGLEDALLGDPTFDARFIVKATDISKAVGIIDAKTREQIESLRGQFDNDDVFLSIDSRQLTLSKRAADVDETDLREFLHTALDFCRQLAARLQHTPAPGITTTCCQVCGDALETDLVFCVSCKTLHHRDCWKYFGACSTYGCQQKRYKRHRPKRRKRSQPTSDEKAKDILQIRDTPTQNRQLEEKRRKSGTRRGRREGRRRDGQRDDRRRTQARRRERRRRDGRRAETGANRPKVRNFGPAGCAAFLGVMLFGFALIYQQLPHVRARRAEYRRVKTRLESIGGRISSSSGDSIDGRIELSRTPVTDDDLSHLHLFSSSYDTLNLRGAEKITDAAIPVIFQMKHLSHLDLSDTRITDRGLEYFPPNDERWPIVELNLSGTKITDQGLRRLANWTRIRELDLSNTKISDASLTHLRQMKRLRTLNLAGTSVTGSGLPQLAATALMEVDLSRTAIGDDELRHLGRLADARRNGRIGFILNDTLVTEAAAKQWRKNRPYNRLSPRRFPATQPARPLESPVVNVAPLATLRLSTFERLDPLGAGAKPRYGHTYRRFVQADHAAANVLIDRNSDTTWNTKYWDSPESQFVHNDLRRSHPELHWDAPVDVERVCVKLKHDRVTYFTLSGSRPNASNWFTLAIFEGKLPSATVSGDRSAEWLRIDGLGGDNWLNHTFGAAPESGQLVEFDFRLPRPRRIQKLKLIVRQTSLEPAEVAEIEVYGRYLTPEQTNLASPAQPAP